MVATGNSQVAHEALLLLLEYRNPQMALSCFAGLKVASPVGGSAVIRAR